jgi:predicted TIM-barrel enzyme
VLVTGGGTGREASLRDVDEALRAVDVPVLVASGVSEATLPQLRRVHGVIVGSCLRADGKAGGPVDPRLARRFAEAYWASRNDARTATDPPPPVSVG